ncbi:hybrid sensor histidine kinase/response regulator [Chryseobacterium sp. A301]
MILIVDDSPQNIISLKKVLEKNNFTVDTASSGKEALRKILNQSYVLIILDVQMPEMDGFEVAEAISGFSRAKETAIIFLSAASANLSLITRGYSSGGLDYITKPVDMNILLLKVKTFYRIYEQNRALNLMQDTLRAEIETRKDAERKKDEFISIASHELKTPMTSVKGYIQLMERSLLKGDIETTKVRLSKVQNQIEKLNLLIADLLDISNIESGKMRLNQNYFSMSSLVDRVLEVMQPSNPSIEFQHEVHYSELIYGDENRIEQVVINYLTNAIKYSPGETQVLIKTYEKDNQVFFSVRDKGIGMSEENRRKVFDKFYRIEESSERFQGLGIGLYICKEIIHRHEGTVGVHSKPRFGSEFFFSLPLQLTPIPHEGATQ